MVPPYIIQQQNAFPANTMHSPNAGLMLARRLRRRPNINPASVQCIVFDGLLKTRPQI